MRYPDLSGAAARVVESGGHPHRLGRRRNRRGPGGCPLAPVRCRGERVRAGRRGPSGHAIRLDQPYLTAAGCIAIWLLSLSGVFIWRTRGPPRIAKAMSARAAPPGPRVRAAGLVIVIPLTILYSPTGLRLVAASMVIVPCGVQGRPEWPPGVHRRTLASSATHVCRSRRRPVQVRSRAASRIDRASSSRRSKSSASPPVQPASKPIRWSLPCGLDQTIYP
jgi:hypothetical protein